MQLGIFSHALDCCLFWWSVSSCPLPLPPSFDLVGVHSKIKDIYPFFVAHIILKTGLLILVMLWFSYRHFLFNLAMNLPPPITSGSFKERSFFTQDYKWIHIGFLLGLSGSIVHHETSVHLAASRRRKLIKVHDTSDFMQWLCDNKTSLVHLGFCLL